MKIKLSKLYISTILYRPFNSTPNNEYNKLLGHYLAGLI